MMQGIYVNKYKWETPGKERKVNNRQQKKGTGDNSRYTKKRKQKKQVETPFHIKNTRIE